MQNEVLVSVIIPNYNRGKWLGQTLDSLQAQTSDQWEAILVDDGSTDNSMQIAAQYQQSNERIKVFARHREPSGAPTCRNIGLEKAKGKYMIFLDSDDLLAPHCIAGRIAVMEQHPELDFAVFPMVIFQDDPRDASTYWNLPTDEPDLQRFLRLDAVWQTTGPIWRKESVERIKGFTEGLACWQDVDIHLKALISGLKYKIVGTEPDCYYRRHQEGSVSQAEISSLPKLKSRLQVFRTHCGSLVKQTDAGRNPDLRLKMRILAMNVYLGSIKVHQWRLAYSAFRTGVKLGIFDSSFSLDAGFIFLIFLLRQENRPWAKQRLDKMLKAYRIPSTIGKFEYKPKAL